MLNVEWLKQQFQTHFSKQPQVIVRAPGRINLIGEHTDYNQGLVLPMAINRYVWMAGSSRSDHRIIAHSFDFQNQAEFSLENNIPARSGMWIEYIAGIANSFIQQGFAIQGADIFFAGEVPIGAGLSSSAALEMATARMLSALWNIPWHGPTMAKLGQQAENQWVGVNCGIMDQMISACGKSNHALFLDCKDLVMLQVPFPSSIAVVVLDTSTRRDLSQSNYNTRREECLETAQKCKVLSLRELSIAQFEHLRPNLSDVLQKRGRHVISENQRVLEAVEALRSNDPIMLGKLLNQSHQSLRDDFEVCNDALNTMAIQAQQLGCYGARMTGAGFGGCCIALVEAAQAESFVEQVHQQYAQATGLTPKIYICHSVNGAEKLT